LCSSSPPCERCVFTAEQCRYEIEIKEADKAPNSGADDDENAPDKIEGFHFLLLNTELSPQANGCIPRAFRNSRNRHQCR
jgi:hypothetical protein